MPTQDSELAGDRDLMAAAGADADEEGAQWTGRPGSRPGRFDQHGAGVAASHLATNPLERLNKEVKDRSVPSAPSGQCLASGFDSELALPPSPVGGNL
jgi:hypothetical protein